MRMGLYNTTPAEAEDLLQGLPEADRLTILSAGAVSQPFLAGWFDQDFLCLVGLVPLSVLSDTAHLWMYHTPAVAAHRLMVARHSRELIRRALEVYPRLVGFCGTLQAAMWLHWLGAEFHPSTGPLRPFTIQRPA